MSLQPGDLVDEKYRIVRLIGEGGMGAVYEGEHTRIHRRVAIKVLHAEVASMADSVARFEREAQAAGRIGSEHIVEVLDLGNLPAGARYIVMEFMDGDSLSQRIRAHGRLSPLELYPIVHQLLDALGAAHRAGIVHRDLKPDNVFLLRQRHGVQDFVKLLDFGISKFASGPAGLSMTRTGAVMGTPYYMAPEQAKGSRNLDQRVDLYALGVLMYEALTGQVPFSAETFNELLFKIVLETPRPLEAAAPDIDPELANIVRKAMAREPTERFATTEEFRAALAVWANTALPAAPNTLLSPQPRELARGAEAERADESASLGRTAGTWGGTQPGGEARKQPSRASLYAASAAIVTGVFGVGGFLMWSGWQAAPKPAASATASPPGVSSTLAPATASAAPPAPNAAASTAAAPSAPAPSAANDPVVLPAPPPSAQPSAAARRPNAPSAAHTAAPARRPPAEPPAAKEAETTSSGRRIRTSL